MRMLKRGMVIGVLSPPHALGAAEVAAAGSVQRASLPARSTASDRPPSLDTFATADRDW